MMFYKKLQINGINFRIASRYSIKIANNWCKLYDNIKIEK